MDIYLNEVFSDEYWRIIVTGNAIIVNQKILDDETQTITPNETGLITLEIRANAVKLAEDALKIYGLCLKSTIGLTSMETDYLYKKWSEFNESANNNIRAKRMYKKFIATGDWRCDRVSPCGMCGELVIDGLQCSVCWWWKCIWCKKYFNSKDVVIDRNNPKWKMFYKGGCSEECTDQHYNYWYDDERTYFCA